MIKQKLYILIALIFIAVNGYGQSLHSSKKREKKLVCESCTLKIDSLTIAPKSIRIRSQSDELIEGYEIHNTILYLPKPLCDSILSDTLQITYRVLPFDIEQEYYHLDSTMMKVKDRVIYIGSDYNFAPKGKEIIDAQGLDYNGSFSRGFSVGNSQSLVLNSNFNLQLAGDLGNKIRVVAAISDDNIPIQPEGNTQLIQEFDKVFIKVSRDKTSITAGDYNLERPRSYFINYFKKLKGLSGENVFDFDNQKRLETNGSFAISRGKFARQILDTKEGNQGPYKLTGNNGERFLIVLSGSEKIYLDGKLLKRGLDYDYIIDYNRAEVSFTPNRIIGRESRIIVEYEYRDQNYLRSVYAANAYYTSPKYDLNFNFYNEQDSKTATGDIVLDSLDIQRLSSIGDNLDQATVSSRRMANDSIFTPGQVRYRLNPNVLGDDPDEYYLEYSADLNDTLYVASFIEVGEGKGRYLIDENSIVNGRVYQYVGAYNGKYEPATKLTPPEKKQIMSFGTKFRPTPEIDITSELSLSNTDINRFATLGNSDNIGLAGVFTYKQDLFLNKKKKIRISTDNKLELVDQNYVSLNPYRNAEFNRDWNLGNQQIEGRQNLINSAISFGIADSLNATYSFKKLDIENGSNSYSGINQKADIYYKTPTFNLTGKIDLLSTEGFGEQTTFQRPKVDITQMLYKKQGIKIGSGYEGESNKRSNISGPDTLSDKSFSFDLYKVYLENAVNNKLHYKFQYSTRNDFFPEAQDLQKSIATNEINSSAKWSISPKHSLSFNFGIRDFQVIRKELLPSENNSKRTLIGRLEHNLNALNGLFLTNTNYIINSGQEPKVEFFYEKVATGQGDYIYVGTPDSILINNNFRYVPDQGTGNYIRLSLINNEFITTNNQSLTQSLRLEPKKYFINRKKSRKNKINKLQNELKQLDKIEVKTDSLHQKTLLLSSQLKKETEREKRRKSKGSKMEKIISRFSTISTFRITKKVQDDGSNQQSSFLKFSSDDPNLVSYNSLISTTLFINRGNPTFDIQIGNKLTDNVFTQISGREERNNDETFLRSRIKLGKSSDFIINLKNGLRKYTSEQDSTRNLKIDFYSINPELSYRPSSNFRINLLYTYEDRKQSILNNEKATSHDFTLATTYRQASTANINVSLSYVNVAFDGIDDSIIEFDLLQGLKNGQNFIWNTLFTKRLSNSIDLNISYEGRKTGNAPTIHIARAQVKATF